MCHAPFVEPYTYEHGRQATIRDLTCQKDGGRPNRRTSSTSFAQSSMTCCGGSCTRVRMFAQGMLQHRGNPTQTSPLAVSMASIVPIEYVSPMGSLSVSNQKVFYPCRLRYRKCRPRMSSYGCPSRALKQPSVQISVFLMTWLM